MHALMAPIPHFASSLATYLLSWIIQNLEKNSVVCLAIPNQIFYSVGRELRNLITIIDIALKYSALFFPLKSFHDSDSSPPFSF